MKKTKKQMFMENWLPPLAMLVLLLFVLEYVLGWLKVSEYVLPRISSIIKAAAEYFRSAGLKDWWSTLSNMIIGYVIAVPVGMICAGLLAQSKVAVKAFSPLIVMLATTPLMVLVPMLKIWMGWGSYVIYIGVAIQATPIILLNTLAGFTNVPIQKEEMARLYAANRFNRFFKIVVPQAWPRIFTGLRLGCINATLGVIGAEFTMKATGLGYRILASTFVLNIPLVFACILMVAVTSRLLMRVVTAVEKRVVVWKQN